MARTKRNPLPSIEYLDRVDDTRREELDRFAERIGIKIKDYNLINRALSHKSYTNEHGYSHNEQYEKLEFFGDGVLGLIVNEYLFKVFPDSEEGELAKIKSAVVSEVSLAAAALEMDLGEVILIGRGETRSRGVERPSLLADVLEALTGAIFLDQGLPAVRRFVLGYIESSIRQMSTDESVGDAKSYLQELVQREFGVRPVYDVRRSSGPDHSRIFRMEVLVRGKKWGEGSGKSKKEAEQDAAEKALAAWESDPEKLRRSERSGGRGRGGRDSGRDAGRSSGRGRDRASQGDEPREKSTDSRREPREEKPREARQPRRDQTRGGESTRRASNQRGGQPRSGQPRSDQPRGNQPRGDQPRGDQPRSRRAPREKEEHAFIPPAEIDDPIAWAAGEIYTPRTGSRTPQGGSSASGRRRRRR